MRGPKRTVAAMLFIGDKVLEKHYNSPPFHTFIRIYIISYRLNF